MSERERQIERLARRINWLDRYRRLLAVVLAILSAAILMWRFTGWFPTSWPGHIVVMTVALGVVCWYGIETVLGFTLAFWETDHAGLTRRPTLPRARLLRRK